MINAQSLGAGQSDQLNSKGLRSKWNCHKNNSGQAMIEFLISIMGLGAGLLMFLSLILFVIIHFQIQNELQKGLICLTSNQDWVCERQARKSLHWFQSFGRINQLTFSDSGSHLSAQAFIQSPTLLGQQIQRRYSLQAPKL